MSQQQTGFAPTNTIWTQNQTQMAAAAVASKNNPQIEALNMQQQTLRDQIRQSEQNLSAQHGVIVLFSFFLIASKRHLLLHF
jgi:capsule polysaccharide export protein KpsE/RkpR